MTRSAIEALSFRSLNRCSGCSVSQWSQWPHVPREAFIVLLNKWCDGQGSEGRTDNIVTAPHTCQIAIDGHYRGPVMCNRLPIPYAKRWTHGVRFHPMSINIDMVILPTWRCSWRSRTWLVSGFASLIDCMVLRWISKRFRFQAFQLHANAHFQIGVA